MKLVVQIAKDASCIIDNKTVGHIDYGYMVLVGITHGDTKEIVDKMADKFLKLRIFKDENDKTNLSLADVKGSVLSISQFTLYADCSKGNRPSFTDSAKRELATELYDYFNKVIEEKGYHVETGVFGADMQIKFTNDGPFTIILDSKELF